MALKVAVSSQVPGQPGSVLTMVSLTLSTSPGQLAGALAGFTMSGRVNTVLAAEAGASEPAVPVVCDHVYVTPATRLGRELDELRLKAVGVHVPGGASE